MDELCVSGPGVPAYVRIDAARLCRAHEGLLIGGFNDETEGLDCQSHTGLWESLEF